jgi:hypothetical protein
MSTKPVKFSFEAAKIKRAKCGTTELKTFHMREVDGRDEELAANWAKNKGGAASSSEELVRLSIVAVNGDPIQQPYLKFDTWNQRARAFALRAFNDLNGFSDKEAADFLETAEEDDVAPLPSGGHVTAAATD